MRPAFHLTKGGRLGRWYLPKPSEPQREAAAAALEAKRAQVTLGGGNPLELLLGDPSFLPARGLFWGSWAKEPLQGVVKVKGAELHLQHCSHPLGSFHRPMDALNPPTQVGEGWAGLGSSFSNSSKRGARPELRANQNRGFI